MFPIRGIYIPIWGLGEANYKQLKSGKITIKGKVVPTSPLSSYSRARDIAEELKKWIADKKFFLTEYVQGLPGADSGTALKGLKERPVEGE
jgi:L-aspartate semialdehyde sulfurtransferase